MDKNSTHTTPPKGHLVPRGARGIASTVARGEARAVVGGLLPCGTLAVHESSEGELTQHVFGSPWREALVEVPSCWAWAALDALGFGEPLERLRVFFQTGDRHLSDFMDLLDARHIPYRYRVLLPGAQVVSRDFPRAA